LSNIRNAKIIKLPQESPPQEEQEYSKCNLFFTAFK